MKVSSWVKTGIVNVVETASIGQQIDLEEMRNHKEIFYDSDVYDGRVTYFKTEKIQDRVLVLHFGKMISVGIKNEQEESKELLHICMTSH